MKRFLEILKGTYIAVFVLIVSIVVILFAPFWLMLITGSKWALLGFFLNAPIVVAEILYFEERSDGW